MKIMWINREQKFLWCQLNGLTGGYMLGLTEDALNEIGEVTYLETPEPWKVYRKGEVFATLESRKGAWELKMPFDGRCLGESRTTVEKLNKIGKLACIAEFRIDSKAISDEECEVAK